MHCRPPPGRARRRRRRAPAASSTPSPASSRCPSVSGTDAENDLQHSLATTLTSRRPGGRPLADRPADAHRGRALPRHGGRPRSEAWGLVGRLPGTDPDAPSLMLNAHLDVVPTGDQGAWAGYPFAAAVRDGELHGRGACDMKGGLAAALLAVRALVRSGVRLPGDVLLAPVQGEEDGGLGTFALLERGWRAGACVVPEPTDLNIVPANAGALTFRLTVPGAAPRTPPGAPRASARSRSSCRCWPRWPGWRTERNRDVDPLMTRWELAYPTCVGTVHAGDWASSVPDLLVAEGRLGVALDEPVEQARRRAGGGRRRGLRRRPLAGRAPGRRRVVGRAVRQRAHRPRRTRCSAAVARRARRRRGRLAGDLRRPVRQRPAPAHRDRRRSPRCSTAPGSPRWRTPPRRASPSTTWPRWPARSPCSRWRWPATAADGSRADAPEWTGDPRGTHPYRVNLRRANQGTPGQPP